MHHLNHETTVIRAYDIRALRIRAYGMRAYDIRASVIIMRAYGIRV